MYKIYNLQCICVLLHFIAIIIVNEQYAILLIVHITISLFVVR
jgi:hypothetical protein